MTGLGYILNLFFSFVGANNINLLEPNGQFGTRIMGGSDAASARYIHTELNPIVDKIFPSKDFPLLDYIDDDGLIVEPKWYCPIIPMVLINGMVGIGTGFSTNIPLYDPFKIIKNIERKLDKDGPLPYLMMEPHYNKFKGQIVRKDKFHFITKGLYQVFPNDNKVIITELLLPILPLVMVDSGLGREITTQIMPLFQTLVVLLIFTQDNGNNKTRC